MALRTANAQLVTVAQVRAADCACITADTPDDDTINGYIDAASDAVAMVTGGLISGRRTVKARPCRTTVGLWCECCGVDAIPLGDNEPEVTEVKIDGDVLDPSTYELHPSRVGWNLVKVSTTTRPTAWPSSQSMWRPDTEDDTFSITFTEGTHVDGHLVESAALEIVCDLASETIRRVNELPDGVTTANLGGVTVVVDSDRLERIARGELGSNVTRMMGLYAPSGRTGSLVWAPEVSGGWDLHLRPAA